MRAILIAAAIAVIATSAYADSGRGKGGHNRGGQGRGGWHWNEPGGRPKPVPEIDMLSGLGALATLGAAGALVWERRRRES